VLTSAAFKRDLYEYWWTYRRLPEGDQYGQDDLLRHVWLGTSVEDQQRADERIPHLLATPAAVRFLSCEPLLGPVDLSQFLRYNPGYEQHTEGRGIGVRSGDQGGDRDRLGGEGLAHGEAWMGSVAAGGSDEPLRNGASGASASDRVSPGAGDAQWEASQRTSASAGVASFQWSHSGWVDDHITGTA